MPKLKLPQLPRIQSKSGISFEPPASALKRWNASMRAQDTGDAVIPIYEFIGDDGFGGGVTAARVAAMLRTIGDREVVVNINSPGGDAFEGAAIYNLLRNHTQKITVRVLGMAASAASVIAMAGDEIQIGRAAFMMVHNIWVLAVGNRNDLRKIADTLEPFDDTFAAVYAARTGNSKADVAAMMDNETWFTGEEAVAQGFADEFLQADQVTQKKDDATTASSVKHHLDVALAVKGMPRVERRALLRQCDGMPGAAAALLKIIAVTPGADDEKRAEQHQGFLATLAKFS